MTKKPQLNAVPDRAARPFKMPPRPAPRFKFEVTPPRVVISGENNPRLVSRHGQENAMMAAAAQHQMQGTWNILWEAVGPQLARCMNLHGGTFDLQTAELPDGFAVRFKGSEDCKCPVCVPGVEDEDQPA